MRGRLLLGPLANMRGPRAGLVFHLALFHKACSLPLSQASLLLNQGQIADAAMQPDRRGLETITSVDLRGVLIARQHPAGRGMHRPVVKSSTNQSRGVAWAAIPLADIASTHAATHRSAWPP